MSLHPLEADNPFAFDFALPDIIFIGYGENQQGKFAFLCAQRLAQWRAKEAFFCVTWSLRHTQKNDALARPLELLVS